MPGPIAPLRFGALRLAVLFSFLLHGLLIVSARYRLSYDAYNHMFFGDHYRMDWWSLWDPRWYTGFYVNSYPPLIHQLIGALGHVVSLDAAFGLILWIVVTILPLAVFCFARIFAGRTVAGYAALGAAFLPSAYLTAHIFGQLPTLAASVTALFAMSALNRYLREGDRRSGVLTVCLLSTVMAFHHATLLFLPWLVIAILSHLLMAGYRPWQTLALRLLIVGGFSALAMLTVIWPFWEWGQAQSIQTPIDHASRHNYFDDPLAALLFFLPMYGPLAVMIPAALRLAWDRRLPGFAFAFLLLFLLGLGSTTPLPRLLFGAGWEWLTYDRFAFWATLTLMPFLGMIIILLRHRGAKWVRTKIFLALGASSMIVGLITVFLPLQPGPVDMRQVLRFLKQGDHGDWRYVTFGFGDQLALLSTLTTATTIDGSYHTARALPELRTSGIGQIDTAFWIPDGLSRLDPILQKSGEHGVRWGFVNVEKYVPVLERNGWVKIKTLQGGVQVWENPRAELPTTTLPPEDPLASFSWGVLPVLSLVASLSLGTLSVWPVQAEKALRAVYSFIVALLPFGVSLWYFIPVYENRYDRIYFTYTDALFFLSDALMLLAVLFWLAAKTTRSPQIPLATYHVLPAAFCLLASLSLLWSRDWRTSLYMSAHVLLVFLFILSLRDRPQAWKFLLLGFCAALSIQVITGIVAFVSQSTAFLQPLGLNWPGPLDPSIRGAIVVQLPGGDSFLRTYGTLPHPNILGGLTLIFLLGPIGLFLRKERPNPFAVLLLIAGVALLALTFSRSAWLALVLFSLVLVWKWRSFNRKRLAIVLSIIALSFLLTLSPYRELVQARTINTTSHSEEFSLIGRAWLNGQAQTMIVEHPLTGVGIGSFIIELAQRAGTGYVVEPAHNIFLMAGAELGIPGLLLVIALFVSFSCRLSRTQNPSAILAGAALTGLGFIGLFDHYLWTLAPGRLMLGVAIGLFVGQEIGNDA